VIKKLVFALLLFGFAHHANAVTVTIDDEPFFLEQGAGPLSLSASLTNRETLLDDYLYEWRLAGVIVSDAVLPVLSWLDIESATGGGALGEYELALDVAAFYEECRFVGGTRICIDLLDRGRMVTSLTITAPSAVPVPAAAWLFGTALIGLVGFSKRKSKVAA